MSTLRNPLPLTASQTRALLVSLCAALCALALARQADPRAYAAPLAAGHTYLVNSTFDAPDADVGDGICASATNGCTLRAAIMQANFLTGSTPLRCRRACTCLRAQETTMPPCSATSTSWTTSPSRAPALARRSWMVTAQ